jgi:hypothetical protein
MTRVSWTVLVVVLAASGCSEPGGTGSSSSSSGSSSGGGNSSSGGSASSSSSAPACDAANPCLVGTCCAGACVNQAEDANHCGGCGVPCGAAQVCLSSTCHDAVLANACWAATALVLMDEHQVDAAQGQAVGVALQGACSPFNVTEGSLLGATYVSMETDLPLASEERMLVVMGGPMVNRVVNAYELDGSAPLVFDRNVGPDHRVIRLATTHEVVLDAQDALITTQHDWFLVETFRDSVDGRLVLVAYGLGTLGTTAAGHYVQQVLVPSLPSQLRAWMVVEWTAQVAGVVGAQDVFTQVAASP